MSSSAYRFLSTSQRSVYSVQRGDRPIGFVTKNEHRIHGRVITSGWTPTTPNRVDLKTEKTREAAADALWRFHQATGGAQ